MFFLSVVTSIKDYIEIAHKLIELDHTSNYSDFHQFWSFQNYTEFGALATFFLVSLKNFFISFFSLDWIKNLWCLPIIVPDISSAMISETSVINGFVHNNFTFLETPVSYGNQNFNVYIIEKFFIGFVNSFFFFLPTSTAHIITLRRFVMQGLEAGSISALGTIAGNILWISSVIFGWRFFIIPWLSLDIFRYLLGFILLSKYMWDSSKERRQVLQDVSKIKIFLLNFILALTEQTSIYPFINNLSIAPESSVLETFPAETLVQFFLTHAFYIIGLLLGSLSLLKFTCWFWETPAFNLYMWVVGNNKSIFSSFLKNKNITPTSYYKFLNFSFLYLTMLCAVSSFSYFGLDYTVTNPLGFLPQDSIIQQKKFNQTNTETERFIPEASAFSINATDKNRRIREGVRARRERWKERLIKYQAFDSSLYDQSMYSFLTLEDLNYGFDKFWLRRKMRNHKINFRLIPGPFMRSLKKQLNNNNLLESEKSSVLPSEKINPNYDDEQISLQDQPSSSKSMFFDKKSSFSAENTKKTSVFFGTQEKKGLEFFRLLFEQYYHPSFHKIEKKNLLHPLSGLQQPTLSSQLYSNNNVLTQNINSTLQLNTQKNLVTFNTKPNKPNLVNSVELKKKFLNPINNSHLFFYKQPSLKTKSFLYYNSRGNFKKTLTQEFSVLRKFVRKFKNRIKSSVVFEKLRSTEFPVFYESLPKQRRLSLFQDKDRAEQPKQSTKLKPNLLFELNSNLLVSSNTFVLRKKLLLEKLLFKNSYSARKKKKLVYNKNWKFLYSNLNHKIISLKNRSQEAKMRNVSRNLLSLQGNSIKKLLTLFQEKKGFLDKQMFALPTTKRLGFEKLIGFSEKEANQLWLIEKKKTITVFL